MFIEYTYKVWKRQKNESLEGYGWGAEVRKNGEVVLSEGGFGTKGFAEICCMDYIEKEVREKLCSGEATVVALQ